MTGAIATTLHKNLETILGADWVAAEQLETRWQQALTQLLPKKSLPCLALPRTVEALSEVVRAAHQNKWRVLPCGNGSTLTWGGLPADIDLVLSTAQLESEPDHAVGDLTITASAGARFASLQTQLQAQGQFIALDPFFTERSTLGGLMATAQAGSLRQRYGTLRDMVLGVQFVRADGQVAKAGGRVVKNVAGYDLMKLLTGSYGTLGIVTEVTLRVYPLPEAWQTVVLSGSTPELAQAAATIAASALTPVAFDVVSAGVLQALAIDSPLGLALRFGTMPVSIEQQTEQLKAIAQSLKLTIHVLREQQDREFWPQLTNSIQPDPDLSLCKFGVLPNAAVHVLDQLVALGGAETKGQIYRGTGVGWLAYPARSLTVELVQKWRSLCEDQGGFLSLLHAPPELKQKIDVWGYPGNATQTMQALKQQFDPLALLSPGCFVAGI